MIACVPVSRMFMSYKMAASTPSTLLQSTDIDSLQYLTPPEPKSKHVIQNDVEVNSLLRRWIQSYSLVLMFMFVKFKELYMAY